MPPQSNRLGTSAGIKRAVPGPSDRRSNAAGRLVGKSCRSQWRHGRIGHDAQSSK